MSMWGHRLDVQRTFLRPKVPKTSLGGLWSRMSEIPGGRISKFQYAVVFTTTCHTGVIPRVDARD